MGTELEVRRETGTDPPNRLCRALAARHSLIELREFSQGLGSTPLLELKPIPGEDLDKWDLLEEEEDLRSPLLVAYQQAMQIYRPNLMAKVV